MARQKTSQSRTQKNLTSLAHLPVPPTSLIGRQHELEQVQSLLRGTQLLTLIGPGGCGKTRLALALAERVAETSPIEHGAWFVALDGLDQPALVPQVIASALGVQEITTHELIDTLADYLRSKKLLLILDNCEHLLEACASLAEKLLANCTHLRLIVTSREPLGYINETVWLVPPLSQPDLQSHLQWKEWAQTDALRLFATRAQAVLPDWRLTEQNVLAVARICQRLDGIPLAIELAASRVKMLDVEQIAARLDDALRLLTRGNRTAVPRHQMMRTAIDWSYDLLDTPAQTLFRRLAIFAGSFTLEAAESVCADVSSEGSNALAAEDVLDALTDLVNKSLALISERIPGEAVRYRLLETMRQYALEKLQEIDEETVVRDRHLAYFLDFAERTRPELKSQSQVLWLKRLDKELDNFRAALAWGTRGASSAVDGLRLAQALNDFWQRRGYWHEGRNWLNQVIENYDAHPDSHSTNGDRYLARAIVAEGLLAYAQGDYGGRRESLERGLALAQALEDSNTMSFAQGLQAQLTSYAGNVDDAVILSEASVINARQSGQPWTLAWAGLIRGMILYRRDETAAQVVLDESERLFREVGDWRSIATHLNVKGYIVANAGQFNVARGLFEEALAIGSELEDKNLQVTVLGNLAHLARLQGDTKRAADLYKQVLEQARDSGQKEKIAVGLEGLGHIRLVQGDLNTASQLLHESLRLYQEIGFHDHVVFPLAGLSRIAAMQGQKVSAARVIGAIEAFLKMRDARLDADDQAVLEQDKTGVRATMTLDEFEAAFASGRALILEQAIEEVSSIELTTVRMLQSPSPIDTLYLYALGPMRAQKGEQDLTTWSYSKVKVLLFYLASYPARTKAQIGLALWPEASPAQLRNNLGMALYHLRRVLGKPEWIIFEDEQYRFNRADHYWFDVEALENNLLEAARQQSLEPERALVLLEQAAEFYQGDFVEDLLEGEWFILRREALRRKYLDTLLDLGGIRFTRGEYEVAAEIYRKAIAKDEILEAAHRELIRCYARLGERGQALRHYQMLIELMREELNSTPAPETQALYEKLRRDESI